MNKSTKQRRRKHPTSFRLSLEALELIAQLAATYGLSQAGIVEMAVRELARKAKGGK